MAQLTREARKELVLGARSLGMTPSDLLAIMWNESARTLDPHKVGGDLNHPNGPFIGMIQFGKNERETYNYRPDMTQAEQIREMVVPFIRDRAVNWYKANGVEPDMSLGAIYTTVLGGNPGVDRNTRDSNGSINDHIASLQREAVPIARSALVGVDTNPTLLAVMSRARELMPGAETFGMYPTGGTRTPEEQAALVRAGWSKTHNSDHLDGAAIDLIPLDKNGNPQPNDLVRYGMIKTAMEAAAKELGVELDIGANWTGFKDRPHFALKDPSQVLPATYDAASGVWVPQWNEPPPTVPFSPEMVKELEVAGYPGLVKPIPTLAPMASVVPTPPPKGFGRETELAMLERTAQPPAMVAGDTPPQVVKPAGLRVKDDPIIVPSRVEPGRVEVNIPTPRTRPDVDPDRSIRELLSNRGTSLARRVWSPSERDAVNQDLLNRETWRRPEGDEFTKLSIERPQVPPRGTESYTPFTPTPVRLQVTGASGQARGANAEGTLAAAVPTPRPRPDNTVTFPEITLRETGRSLRTQVGVRPEPAPASGMPAARLETQVVTPPERPIGELPRGLNVQPVPGRVQLRVGGTAGPGAQGTTEYNNPIAAQTHHAPQEPEPLQNVGRGTSASDTTGVRDVTVSGAEIRSPQPGALRGIESRPPPEVRSGVEQTFPARQKPVGLNSQMVMGIGVPPAVPPAPPPLKEARTKDDVYTPVTPAPVVTAPPPPPAPPSVDPRPPGTPVAPEAPIEVGPATVTPGIQVNPATVPPPKVTQPVPPPPPVQQPTQPIVTSGTTFAKNQLAPAGNTVTGPVVGANFNERSGGSKNDYQTSVDSRGNSVVSWTTSSGRTITTYTDPSMGSGPIHQAGGF